MAWFWAREKQTRLWFISDHSQVTEAFSNIWEIHGTHTESKVEFFCGFTTDTVYYMNVAMSPLSNMNDSSVSSMPLTSIQPVCVHPWRGMGGSSEDIVEAGQTTVGTLDYSLTALNLSRDINAVTKESSLSEGGDSFVVSPEPCSDGERA